LCPSTRLSAIGKGGFTLIEALAALAVASTGIAAIGSLSFSGLRSGMAVEHHIAMRGAAQKIVTGLPDREDVADGHLTGIMSDYQWRIDAGPFGALSPRASETVWRPQRIALHVRGPDGAVFEIDTIRLRKRAAQ
jgi:general secretion pathway protein I